MLKLVFSTLSNRLFFMLIIIFILLEFNITRKLITKNEKSYKDTLLLAIIFGSLGIIGTYWGIDIKNAIANSRIIGVFVGGIIGGPIVGTMAGIIAGSHRYLIDIGGFTAFSCSLSTILGGIISGQLSKHYKRSKHKVLFSIFWGVVVESIQMLIIILLSKPSAAALDLVKVIGLPMVASNAFGITIFLLILSRMISEKERDKALLTQIAFNIANDSSYYFKEGYNEVNSLSVAKIIIKQTSFSSITFTNNKHIISSAGDPAFLDFDKDILQRELSKEIDTVNHSFIQELKNKFYLRSEESSRNTYIESLKVQDKVIGYIVATSNHSVINYESESVLLSSIANLLSTQIELSEIEEQRKLLNQAELLTLQAQINPHFLFNALNTISILIKHDPVEARRILLHLSDYFRSNINNSLDEVSIHKELEHINSYVEIEKARFQDKLNVVYNVPDNVDCDLPELIIQPLVENAIKHGICKKFGSGTVHIDVKDNDIDTLITISDDGIGMNDETLISVLNEDVTDKIGLKNVNQRLIKRYGEEFGLDIESEFNVGTTIKLKIPKKELRYA